MTIKKKKYLHKVIVFLGISVTNNEMKLCNSSDATMNPNSNTQKKTRQKEKVAFSPEH